MTEQTPHGKAIQSASGYISEAGREGWREEGIVEAYLRALLDDPRTEEAVAAAINQAHRPGSMTNEFTIGLHREDAQAALDAIKTLAGIA